MCSLWFLAISAVLSLLFHHCYSSKKTKSRLHTPFSTVVHAKVVCTPKILPIGIFLSHSSRSKIIASWDMSQYQNSPCISLKTSVFYLHFRVRFSLAMLLIIRLDTAAERLGYEVNFLFRECFLSVGCPYFEIFIVVNRPYFVSYTNPYSVFKFSTVPLET